MIQHVVNLSVLDITAITQDQNGKLVTGHAISGEQEQKWITKMATTQQRLDRIEEKIDKLADAIVSLARAEERIASIADMQSHQTERLNRLSNKIDDIAAQAADNARTVQLINKLFWIVIAAAVAAVASNIWM